MAGKHLQHFCNLDKVKERTSTQNISGRRTELTKSILEVHNSPLSEWDDSIYMKSVTASCLFPCVGALPVPLSQYAQLQTPLTGPLAAPGAQRLQWEGLSISLGPHTRLSGGQHWRWKCRRRREPGQSGCMFARFCIHEWKSSPKLTNCF